MSKKVAIYYPEIFDVIDAYFKEKDVEIVSFDGDLTKIDCEIFDLIIFYDSFGSTRDYNNVLNVHPALLPSYKCEGAIEKIFSDGVKVGGVTIHSKDKIIAQYPILIGMETHIDDYLEEVHSILKKLLPFVIESILSDRVFDFNDLFSNPCQKSGGCSGCGGCHQVL